MPLSLDQQGASRCCGQGADEAECDSGCVREPSDCIHPTHRLSGARQPADLEHDRDADQAEHPQQS